MDKTTKSKSDIEKFARDYVTKIPDIEPTLKEPTVELITNMVSHEAYGNQNYKWSIDDFELGRRLGRGKFGRVYSAREKKTGYVVALKTLSKYEVVEGRVERQILREIEIQSNLKHPNILQLLTWFDDDFRIYLVLQYAGQGELYGVMKKLPGMRFGQHLSAKYTYQVADALHYCHQNEVIHRDIKPENLLLTHDGNIKLADFGWSVHAPSLRRKTMCGTLDYLPPEMVVGEEYGKYVDNWCLGVLCYEFLCGCPPFESETTTDTYRKISSVEITFPSAVPPGAQDLITKLLTRINTDRLSLPNVKIHPWIVKNK